MWDEVANELAAMKTNEDMIKKMDKKGKGKKGKKGKGKKKGKKGKLVYEPPAPVGPVGDDEAEKAFAELVSEGVIKQPKPACFSVDFAETDQYAVMGSK